MMQRRWQFSIRELMLFTTLVAASVSLAVAQPAFLMIPWFVMVLVYFGCRLNSSKRPRLAFATCIMAGTILCAMAEASWREVLFDREIAAAEKAIGAVLFLVFASCGVLAFLLAQRVTQEVR